MSLLAVVAVIVVGAASGVLSGMFGVGGAVLTTPGIRFFGATPIEALGSTIPAILPGSISGAWRYSRAGMVDWRIAITSGVLGSGFAVAGAELSDHVNAHYLMLLTAVLLLWSAVRNIQQRAAVAPPVSVPVGGPADGEPLAPVVDRGADGRGPVRAPLAIVGLIGAASGLLAGLLGVGGGILLVPAYTAFLRVPPKRAVATSLVAVAMFSVPAMVRHAQLGHIHWGYALLLMVGVVPGAQLGSRLTIHGSEARLRLLMGVFFAVLAIGFGTSELLAL